jgi:GTP-binding protein Era
MTGPPGPDGAHISGGTPPEFHSGFVTILGRPNVGKSTLVNALVGTKVAIVSDKPQTTRTAIRGVRTTAESQIVLLDTPGVHRPRTLLGERTNQRAIESLASVDVVCVVIAANEQIGPGDRFVADLADRAAPPARIAVVSKTDAARHDAVGAQLGELASGALGAFDAYVPLSARTGDGLDALVSELEARLPEGPSYYPPGAVSDQPESFLAAELVREQLLAGARDELPHSITVSVDEVEERTTNAGEPLLALRCIVRVERDSQKGIVIGRGGERLKLAGRAARLELEALLGTRVHLETHVKVDPDWQRRAHALDRLGY